MSGPLQFAVDLALRIGGRLRDAAAEPPGVRRKGDRDLVTEMDTVAEGIILEAIRTAYPDHAVLAEESGLHGVVRGYRWLVDPLDGTVNYAHRWPHWAISLALEENGTVVLGVTYAPMTGELFWGERGKGAFKDDRRLRVSPCVDLEDALITVGSLSILPGDSLAHSQTPGAFSPDAVLADLPVVRLIGRVFKMRQTGCCTLDLAWLADGRAEGCFQGHCFPWDAAAGRLLLEEAGGRISTLDGAQFLGDEPSFLASNGSLHETMLKALRGGS